MKEPTKEQQDIIEKAAKKHADMILSLLSKDPYLKSGTDAQIALDFMCGVSFALSSPDLLRGVLEEFAEWADKNHINGREQAGQWAKRGEWGVWRTVSATAELVTKFLTDKQKEV